MILYRPVGTEELELIEEMGFAGFPPRLREQPIFIRCFLRSMPERSPGNGM